MKFAVSLNKMKLNPKFKVVAKLKLFPRIKNLAYNKFMFEKGSNAWLVLYFTPRPTSKAEPTLHFGIWYKKKGFPYVLIPIPKGKCWNFLQLASKIRPLQFAKTTKNLWVNPMWIQFLHHNNPLRKLYEEREKQKEN